jgi:hypothetical protein
MPAPTVVPTSYAGNQGYASVAFDNDTTYLVVWADQFGTTSSNICGARVAQSGTVLDWNGGILISNATNAQENPAVAFDGTNYLVVWQDKRGGTYYDIYGQRVNTSGGLVGSEITISSALYNQQSPGVAFDGTNYLVVWQDRRGGSSYDIYGQRVNTSGGLVGSAITISNASGNQSAPSVAFDGTNYLVAWQDTSSYGYDICGIRVSTGGALVGSKITISNATNNQQSPSVAYGNGYYLVAWQDYRNGTTCDIYGARVNTSGVVYGPITISNATNNQQSPSVAYDGTNCLVAWQDYRNSTTYSDIYGARVNTDGTVLDGSGIEISLADSSQECPAVVGSGSSGFLAVWQDTRNGSANYDTYGARISAGGSVTDYPNGILLTGVVNAQTNPAVAFDGTNYLVVWDDNRYGYSDICGARVSLSGAALDPAGFLISSNTSTSNQTYPAVAFDGTDYMVVWQDARNSGTGLDIYGARVSKTGAVLDGSGIAISAATANQYYPAVAFGGTNYLVVWHDYRNSATYTDVYGARVTTAGGVLDQGSNAIPISTADNNQRVPAVAFDGSNYLVVWHDNRGANYDIYGARVSEAGQVQDASGIAISTAAGHQYYPAVAFDGTNYLVAWHDGRTSGTTGLDIYGARVSGAGGVLDAGGIPMSTAANDQQIPAVAFDGTNYLVAWYDLRNGGLYSDIYGCRVNRAGQVGEEYAISTQTNSQTNPIVACGEGTVLVAYPSVTGAVEQGNYQNTYRVWARLGTLPLTADVGADSILRPFASFLMPSWRIPPLVRIRNYGAQDQGPFSVRFTAGTYSSTKSVPSLAAGDTCTVEFDSLTLTTGAFTIKCSTMLYADQHSGNNAQTACFQGCTFIDFFDLTDGGLVPRPATGKWIRGRPWNPWTLPPMDDTVWGDRLNGYYGNSTNDTLTSPTYKATQDTPVVAFQHSFSTESLMDGGNFSYYSNKTGSTWIVLTPSGGLEYNGRVSALGPDTGWSGNSSGWKQSVFKIPVKKDTQFQVRWHFASGPTNNSYRGWLIDEVAGINCAPAGGKLGAAGTIDTLKVWPNPARGKALVRYTLWRDCNVSINLYDASGRLAARVPTSGFKKGPNTAKLDASRLARGVYFVKVKVEADTKTTKVIIE